MLGRTVALWRSVIGGRARKSHENATGAPGDDRRLWDRFSSEVDVACRPVGAAAETRFTARVRNASHGGISLTVPCEFVCGDLLSVELPGADAQSSTTVLACVMHAARESPDAWSVGCNFSGELSDDELATLGARRSRASPADQRNWQRFDCDVQATVETVAGTQVDKQLVNVLNISATGIALSFDRPIEVGTLFSVELHNAAGKHTTVLACAVHVTARAAKWTVGCNFMRMLSEQELMSLR